jgi:hypothetical protein
MHCGSANACSATSICAEVALGDTGCNTGSRCGAAYCHQRCHAARHDRGCNLDTVRCTGSRVAWVVSVGIVIYLKPLCLKAAQHWLETCQRWTMAEATTERILHNCSQVAPEDCRILACLPQNLSASNTMKGKTAPSAFSRMLHCCCVV